MKKYLFFSMAALALASCGNHEPANPAVAEEGLLQVSGSVTQLLSRATDTDWEANDQIGISTDLGHTNVLYTTADGDGTFVSDTKVYITGSANHTVTAYYPYAADLADNGAITFTEPTDYLWAKAENVTHGNPKAELSFNHMMSKLCVKFVDNNSETFGTGVTYEIRNIAMAGQFDTKTGVVTASDETTTIENIDLNLGNEQTWIVPTQTLADGLTLALTYDGKKYTAKINPALAAGTEYHFTIDLTDRDADANLGVSATISGWSTADEITSGVTEETEEENAD